jgi:hypothetical protein
MKSFLDKTAEYIIENFIDEMDQICIVLPNRRAGLFLKKSLADKTKKTIWAPQIYSLEDFIISLSGFKIIDPVYLQFELYRIHKEIEGINTQSFEDFIKWGRVLLNDFNELDKYLVDPMELFGYLTDEKALSLWNPESAALSEFQVKYLRFYQSLNSYYSRLSTELIRRNEVYQGLAYRKVAQNIETSQNQLQWKRIFFAGFNALTKAEKKIISILEDSGKAELLWDADRYYIEDKTQEAGKFIRSVYHQSDKTKFKWLDNNFRETEKKITLYGVPQNVGQVKLTGQLLSELTGQENELDQTVVVLNDESMIESLLNSVPVEAGKFNLTMGLPLRSTPLFRLIESVLELQSNILKLDKSEGGNPKIYYRDLLRVLEHPYMIELLIENELNEIPSEIRKSNRIFLDPVELINAYFKEESNVKRIINCTIVPWKDNPTTIIKSLLSLINELKIYFASLSGHTESGKNIDFKLEYLFHFNTVFQKLNTLLGEFQFVENLKVFRSLFSQVVQVALPFYGEPLHGMQVMGMLEAQALDFRNILMLGVNEDFIPSGKSNNSFIPFDIRRKFSLPTYQDRNAVYAYHFYRLLQRANKVSIIFNTEPGELGGGDKSRFIAQMQYEMPNFNKNIKINERILSVSASTKKQEDGIEITKSDEILKKLKEHASYGFSASALNSYRNCPLQFYFKYIAGIDEADEPEETIDASTLGSVIHDVLAQLFDPCKDRKLSPGDIQRMKSKAEPLIRESFEKNYADGDIDFGKNLLIVKVANQYIHHFLEHEAAECKLHNNEGGYVMIREIEKSFSATVVIDTQKDHREVKLTGRFDRIDDYSGSIRIIDYKTGKVEPNELKFKSWDELSTNSKLDKCFQLLFYAFLYSHSGYKVIQPILPGIISFRNLSQGFMEVKLPDDEHVGTESLRKFGSILKSILSEIFNPEIPFSQTDIVDNCKFCSFASVCNRN